MEMSSHLSGLGSRDAVADALTRAILGIDSNNRSLFESACLTDARMTVIGGGYRIEGWPAISGFFERVFRLVTTHTISNVRIEFQDGKKAANLMCNAIAYHIRPEDALTPDHNKSYTAGCIYNIELVLSLDGLWKIKTWDIQSLWTTGDVQIVHGHCARGGKACWQLCVIGDVSCMTRVRL